MKAMRKTVVMAVLASVVVMGAGCAWLRRGGEEEISGERMAGIQLYNGAREKIRVGDFDGAHADLEEVAKRLPDSPEAKQVKDDLGFTLPFAQARQLTMQGRASEAEPILRDLLAQYPYGERAAMINLALDSAGTARFAQRQARIAQGRSRLNQLRIFLEQYRVEYGAYPRSLDDLSAAQPQAAEIVRSFDEVTDYRTEGETYSLTVLVDMESGTKFTVTDKQRL
ncbi:MAG: hypothetical protein V2A74_07160 [bacterium]